MFTLFRSFFPFLPPSPHAPQLLQPPAVAYPYPILLPDFDIDMHPVHSDPVTNDATRSILYAVQARYYHYYVDVVPR